jgi:branched-chain amino acid transport system permease protein
VAADDNDTDSRLPRLDIAEWTTRQIVVRGLWSLVALVVVAVTLIELATTLRPLRISLTFTLANGIQVGAVYALVALGVALVYKATRVINFAQGVFGSMPALLALWVWLGFDLSGTSARPGPLAFLTVALGAVIFGAALAVLINTVVIRRLADAAPVTSLVATTGVALLIIAVQAVTFEVKTRSFPRLIQDAPGGFAIGPFCFAERSDGECLTEGSLAFGGLIVDWNTILILGVLAVVSISLALFFRSPMGIALLATAQEPYAAELYGVSPQAMSSLAWGIAGGFAALAGILGGGVFETVFPGYMTRDFLIPALVAAVLGGITSMVGAVLGALLVGVVFSLASQIVVTFGLTGTVPGSPQLAIFAVLVLTLALRPRGLFGKEA